MSATGPVPHLLGKQVAGRLEYVEEGKLRVREVSGRLDAVVAVTDDLMVVAIGDDDSPDGGVIYTLPNRPTTIVALAAEPS